MVKSGHAQLPGIKDGLTENEGSLLALVLRNQPITAYQLLRFYEESPTTSINQSKGSVYPMIKRLKQRGYLVSDTVAGDGRNPEMLSCSRSGRKAVQRWVKDLRPEHTLIGDPMRTKVLSFELLGREEQLDWIVEAKALVFKKKEELGEYSKTVSLTFKGAAHVNAELALDAKLRWLDFLLEEVVKRGSTERRNAAA